MQVYYSASNKFCALAVLLSSFNLDGLGLVNLRGDSLFDRCSVSSASQTFTQRGLIHGASLTLFNRFYVNHHIGGRWSSNGCVIVREWGLFFFLDRLFVNKSCHSVIHWLNFLRISNCGQCRKDWLSCARCDHGRHALLNLRRLRLSLSSQFSHFLGKLHIFLPLLAVVASYLDVIRLFLGILKGGFERSIN